MKLYNNKKKNHIPHPSGLMSVLTSHRIIVYLGRNLSSNLVFLFKNIFDLVIPCFFFDSC